MMGEISGWGSCWKLIREEARRGWLVECLPGVSKGEEDGLMSAPPCRETHQGGQLFVLERKKREPP